MGSCLLEVQCKPLCPFFCTYALPNQKQKPGVPSREHRGNLHLRSLAPMLKLEKVQSIMVGDLSSDNLPARQHLHRERSPQIQLLNYDSKSTFPLRHPVQLLAYLQVRDQHFAERSISAVLTHSLCVLDCEVAQSARCSDNGNKFTWSSLCFLKSLVRGHTST